jgi:hypothetical protein
MSAPRARARGRVRYALMTALLIIASTVSLVIAVALGERTAARIDVTSTREHALSPRSRALLGQLRGEYEIVVAGPLKDRRVVDPRSLQRIADVLDQFGRGTPAGASVRPTLIDTGSSAGLEAYERLLSRLLDRDAPRIDRVKGTILGAIASARELAEGLEKLSPRLTEMRDAVPVDAPGAATTRAYFDQRAGESASSARALRELAGRAEGTSTTPAGQLPVPDFDAAAEVVRHPLVDLEKGLAAIASDLSQIAQAEMLPASTRDRAREIAPGAAELRNRAAIIRDALDRLERLDLPRIARALQSSSGVIVVGPTDQGLTGIDFAEVFPPTTAGDAVRVDAGRNAEELFSSALAALAHPVKPVVVLMHGSSSAHLDRFRNTRTILSFELLRQRLTLRGMDVILWPVAESPEPPSLGRLQAAGQRPVVYLVHNVPAHSGTEAGLSGPDRAKRLGAAIASLAESGASIFMSIFPSTLPSYGEPDPTTAWLKSLGLEAQSAKPLLKERLLPEGRRVDAFQIVRTLESEHPIAGAIRGLPTRLEWPIALREIAAESSGAATISPLFVVDDRQVWGESQWLAYLQVPMSQHASVPNPPSRDSTSDDVSSPWMVGVAIERRPPGLDDPQRIVIIGSNSWYSDAVMGEAMHVDGRLIPAHPGNAELLEAGIYWLAGQDTLIAQSASARAAPLIRELDAGVLSALRWLAIAGLPVLVLALGALWRVLRG